ncbi:hypothetical protein B5X24_HaOG211448 [Helicoverpa armigera]|nr:hypothetical protein B5X24_HaOG211448 [Helicoverpa armigera]
MTDRNWSEYNPNTSSPSSGDKHHLRFVGVFVEQFGPLATFPAILEKKNTTARSAPPRQTRRRTGYLVAREISPATIDSDVKLNFTNHRDRFVIIEWGIGESIDRFDVC